MHPEATTRPIFLLGYPVAHSLSPLIHNTAFRTQGLDFVYLAAPVHPRQLSEAVAGLRALGAVGANVTIPHKEAMLPLLDDCSASARAIGAVNTLLFRSDAEGNIRIRGVNTDVSGFLYPLQRFREQVQGHEAVIFGAGGAARAAVYALLTEMPPSRLTLVARSSPRAEKLIRDLQPLAADTDLCVLSPAGAGAALERASLVVNATPVGMHPHAHATIWTDASVFHEGQVVYDLVYRPVRTLLLTMAAARGAHTISGLEMLLEQAAQAYTLWTNHPFPYDAVRAVLTDRLPTTIPEENR